MKLKELLFEKKVKETVKFRKNLTKGETVSSIDVYFVSYDLMAIEASDCNSKTCDIHFEGDSSNEHLCGVELTIKADKTYHVVAGFNEDGDTIFDSASDGKSRRTKKYGINRLVRTITFDTAIDTSSLKITGTLTCRSII